MNTFNTSPALASVIWEEDLLERKQDAEFIIPFLLNRVEERQQRGETKSYVLNIDAPWGGGKTFFLKHLEEDIKNRGYLTCYINAWEDDHAEDPLLAVMAGINDTVERVLPDNQKWKQVKAVAKDIIIEGGKAFFWHQVKKHLGEETCEIALNGAATVCQKENERFQADVFESFNTAKRNLHSFRDNLKDVLEDINKETALIPPLKPPLFVIVDELDRCRPSYAIALLERVKHLFEVDNVIFIIATDSEQLCHSIKAVYGAGFDSPRYLQRFFNRTYTFEKPDKAKYIEALFKRYQLDESKLSVVPETCTPQVFFEKMVNAYDLKLRDIEHVFDLLRSITTAWEDKHSPIELAMMLPLVITEIIKNHASSDKPNEYGYIVPKGVDGWVVPDKKVSPYSENLTDTKSPMFNMIYQFSALSRKSFSLLNDSNLSEKEKLIGRRIRDIINRTHQKASMDSKADVLIDYPRIVRTAGRLLQKDDKAEEQADVAA